MPNFCGVRNRNNFVEFARQTEGRRPLNFVGRLRSALTCTATLSLGSSKRHAKARRRTLAFSPSCSCDHSLLPRVLRQELPTAFLATTAARMRASCTGT